MIDCVHHWHRARLRPDAERESITTGIPKVLGTCCHCGATGHVAVSASFRCGPHAGYEVATEVQKACCVARKES